MERKKVEALIILSNSAEEANEQIEKFLGNVSTKEKIAFLKGMFDVQIISRGQNNDDKTIYYVMLDSILLSFKEA